MVDEENNNKSKNKGVISLRFSDDEIKFLLENRPDIHGDDDDISWRLYFMEAVTKATQKVNNSAASREAAKRIEGLLSDINKLTAVNNDLNNEVEKLVNRINQLENNPQVIEREVFKEREPQDNEIIIQLTPYENIIITETCKHIQKVFKREITPDKLLTWIFTKYTEDGPSDFYPRPFNDIQLKKMKSEKQIERQ